MIIAIGGISNAGKSNLAKRLSDHYQNQSSIVLCQDDFANPTNEIPKIKGHTNWEIPESLDFDKFYKKIIAYLVGSQSDFCIFAANFFVKNQ